jgi:hypothetical protein
MVESAGFKFIDLALEMDLGDERKGSVSNSSTTVWLLEVLGSGGFGTARLLDCVREVVSRLLVGEMGSGAEPRKGSRIAF